MMNEYIEVEEICKDLRTYTQINECLRRQEEFNNKWGSYMSLYTPEEEYTMRVQAE